MSDSGAGGAVSPFPMGDPKDIKQLMAKIQQQMDELYQNRVGGAMLGDVFGVGNDEVLSLILATNGGLTKISNALSLLLKANYGLAMDTSGLYLQVSPNNGLAVDTNGLYVKIKIGGGLNVDATGLSVTSLSQLSGNIAISTAATFVTVTDANVKPTSIIVANFATKDTTGQVKNVVVTTGSFTINVVAPTGNSSINYVGVY